MKNIKALLILILFLSFDQVIAQKSTLLPQDQVQVVPIKDTQNDRAYELYIELPEGYVENPDRQYPVLYYTDAIWHMEILAAGQEYIFNDLILVGISWQKDLDKALLEEAGQQASRYRDYSVIESGNAEIQAKYQLGQASKHLAFIRNDVIKYVEGNYRTDPSSRSYFGYSAGGVFGTYVLLAQPDTFKNYILGSPSLKRTLPYFTELATAPGLESQELQANVFISYGSQEEELSGHVEQLIDLLKARKDGNLNLKQEVPEGSHQTAFPLTGVRGIAWLSGLMEK